jgi:hypothetical protein
VSRRQAPPGWNGTAASNRGYGVEHAPESLGAQRQRRPGRSRDTLAAVKITGPDGSVHWEGLRNDEAAIRAFCEEWAEKAGSSRAELARPFPRGRLTLVDTTRRRQLAELIAAALDAGASQAGLAAALGLNKRRVSELANPDS